MDLREYVRNIIQSRPVTTSSLPTCSAGHVSEDTNQRHTKRGSVSVHTGKHTGKVTVSRGESEGRSVIDAHHRHGRSGKGGGRTLNRTQIGGGAPPPTRWWRFKQGRGTGDARAVMAWRSDDQEQRKEARVSTSVAMDLREYVRNIIQSRPVTTSSLPTCSAGHVSEDTNQRHTKRGSVSVYTAKNTGKVTVSRGESEGRSAIDAHHRHDCSGKGGGRTFNRTVLGGGAPPPSRWWRFKRCRGTGSSRAVL